MSGLNVHVDQASPVPLYHQVAQELESLIERGDLRHGDRLPNETELAANLGISRPTIRRAIGELVDRGMLVRKRGVGTQVLSSRLRRSVELTSLYDDLAKSGRTPTTKVLAFEPVPADEVIADRLAIDQGVEVIRIERLRSADGVPLAKMRNWLPADLAEQLTVEHLEHAGLYDWLGQKGVQLRLAEQQIGARAAEPDEAELLKCEAGDPLVTMERTAFDNAGRAIEFGSHVYDARRYSFQVRLVNR